MKKRKKTDGPHVMSSREQVEWVVEHYTELAEWQAKHGDILQFPFPQRSTYAHAQAILTSDENLVKFLSQKIQGELKAEKRASSGIREDYRRQIDILNQLERLVA